MNITQKEIIKSIDIFLPLIFSPSSLPLISLINNKTFFFFKYRQNACDTDGESSLLIKRIYEWWQEIHDVILHLIPFDLSRLTPIRQSFFFFNITVNWFPGEWKLSSRLWLIDVWSAIKCKTDRLRAKSCDDSYLL